MIMYREVLAVICTVKAGVMLLPENPFVELALLLALQCFPNNRRGLV